MVILTDFKCVFMLTSTPIQDSHITTHFVYVTIITVIQDNHIIIHIVNSITIITASKPVIVP